MRKLITAALITAAALGSAAHAPAGAHAASTCKQWNIHDMLIVQDNHWEARVQQSGTTLGAWSVSRGPGSGFVYGDANGTIGRYGFRFVVDWDNGTSGVYTGTIDRDGYVEGTAADRFNRNSKTRFHMLKRARCTRR